jgi:hypothetical protein
VAIVIDTASYKTTGGKTSQFSARGNLKYVSITFLEQIHKMFTAFRMCFVSPHSWNKYQGLRIAFIEMKLFSLLSNTVLTVKSHCRQTYYVFIIRVTMTIQGEHFFFLGILYALA